MPIAELQRKLHQKPNSQWWAFNSRTMVNPDYRKMTQQPRLRTTSSPHLPTPKVCQWEDSATWSKTLPKTTVPMKNPTKFSNQKDTSQDINCKEDNSQGLSRQEDFTRQEDSNKISSPNKKSCHDKHSSPRNMMNPANKKMTEQTGLRKPEKPNSPNEKTTWTSKSHYQSNIPL